MYSHTDALSACLTHTHRYTGVEVGSMPTMIPMGSELFLLCAHYKPNLRPLKSIILSTSCSKDVLSHSVNKQAHIQVLIS